MDFGAALIALSSAWVVKVAVMALSAWLLWKLRGATHPKTPKRLWLLLPRQDLPEVRMLWWALFLFFVSELTCGVEVYVLLRATPVLTTAHAATSAAGMALFAVGFYRFLDNRLFHFAAPRCLARRICLGCSVAQPEGCKFSTVLMLSSAFVALAALVPLFASTEPMVADPTRYVLPFPTINSWYDGTAVPWLAANIPGYQKDGAAYVIPRAMFVVELRVIPWAAFLFGAAGVWFALRRAVARAAHSVVLGVGVLAYVYFELVLYRGTGEALLGSLLHEVGELWFIVITAELLRRSFPATSEEEARSDVQPSSARG